MKFCIFAAKFWNTWKNSTLDKQKASILSDEEKYNEISTFESVLAGLGSGLIQIPKGLFSLGATLMDMGAIFWWSYNFRRESKSNYCRKNYWDVS